LQEVEFTVENLRLYVLETVRAKRSPRAAVKIAVDMVEEGILTQREALLRVEPKQLSFFVHPMVDDQYCKPPS
jgi:pyruvate,orthophosphate dikinase